MLRIVVAGDSLALPRLKPERITHEQVWPSLLENRLEEGGVAVRVFNHSRRERTIPRLLKEYDDIVTFWEPNICILQVGIVDCAPRLFSQLQNSILNCRFVYWRVARMLISTASRYRRQIITFRPWVRYTSERAFKNSLEQLGRKTGSSICVIVLPILSTFPEHASRSPGYNESVAAYNGIWQHWCNITGAHFIPEEESRGGIEVRRMLLQDGHHLSVEGHRIIADSLYRTILRVRAGCCSTSTSASMSGSKLLQ